MSAPDLTARAFRLSRLASELAFPGDDEADRGPGEAWLRQYDNPAQGDSEVVNSLRALTRRRRSFRGTGGGGMPELVEEDGDHNLEGEINYLLATPPLESLAVAEAALSSMQSLGNKDFIEMAARAGVSARQLYTRRYKSVANLLAAAQAGQLVLDI